MGTQGGDDAEVVLGGYQPELKRTLNQFQVFAISFAFISVAVGIFATYSVVLQTGGPVAIWLWVLVAVGQILVALVFAQFAGRISLSGSSYQWGSRLANPKIGLAFGWLTACYLAIAVVGVDDALANTALMPLFDMRPDETTARVITIVVLLVQVLLVLASTRLASMVNSSAVAIELVIVIALGIALIIALTVSGTGSEQNLVSRGVTQGSPDYFAVGGGLMGAMIMGLATLVGFDAAANLAEEAKNPFRSVPRAIVGSVGAVRSARAGLLSYADPGHQERPRSHLQRLARGDDHSRPARFGDGEDLPSGDHAGVLRRRDRGHDRMFAAHLRDVPRRALSWPHADAARPSPDADADPRDGPDLCGRGRLDDRAARGGAHQADHRFDHSSDDHLRRDDHPLPGGAQTARSKKWARST